MFGCNINYLNMCNNYQQDILRPVLFIQLYQISLFLYIRGWIDFWRQESVRTSEKQIIFYIDEVFFRECFYECIIFLYDLCGAILLYVLLQGKYNFSCVSVDLPQFNFFFPRWTLPLNKYNTNLSFCGVHSMGSFKCLNDTQERY